MSQTDKNTNQTNNQTTKNPYFTSKKQQPTQKKPLFTSIFLKHNMQNMQIMAQTKQKTTKKHIP